MFKHSCLCFTVDGAFNVCGTLQHCFCCTVTSLHLLFFLCSSYVGSPSSCLFLCTSCLLFLFFLLCTSYLLLFLCTSCLLFLMYHLSPLHFLSCIPLHPLCSSSSTLPISSLLFFLYTSYLLSALLPLHFLSPFSSSSSTLPISSSSSPLLPLHFPSPLPRFDKLNRFFIRCWPRELRAHCRLACVYHRVPRCLMGKLRRWCGNVRHVFHGAASR